MIDKEYAFVKDNVVIQTSIFPEVIYVEDIESIKTMLSADFYVESTDNDCIVINSTYVDGEFRLPKPVGMNSWVWDASGKKWTPPVEMPEEIKGYFWEWNESTLSWDQSDAGIEGEQPDFIF